MRNAFSCYIAATYGAAASLLLHRQEVWLHCQLMEMHAYRALATLYNEETRLLHQQMFFKRKRPREEWTPLCWKFHYSHSQRVGIPLTPTPTRKPWGTSQEPNPVCLPRHCRNCTYFELALKALAHSLWPIDQKKFFGHVHLGLQGNRCTSRRIARGRGGSRCRPSQQGSCYCILSAVACCCTHICIY